MTQSGPQQGLRHEAPIKSREPTFRMNSSGSRVCLEKRQVCLSRDRVDVPETCLTKEFQHLPFGTFPTTGSHNEHLKIGEKWFGHGPKSNCLGYPAFDDNQTCAVGHGGATCTQDFDSAFVVPVVDDLLQEIDISAVGNGVE